MKLFISLTVTALVVLSHTSVFACSGPAVDRVSFDKEAMEVPIAPELLVRFTYDTYPDEKAEPELQIFDEAGVLVPGAFKYHRLQTREEVVEDMFQQVCSAARRRA